MISKRYNGLEHVPTCSTWPPPWLAPSPPRVATAPTLAEPLAVVSPSDLPPDLYEFWEERAAIRQFDGGFPRWKAEALALADVLGLSDPPADDAEGNTRSALETATAKEGAATMQARWFAEDRGPYR